MGYIAKQSIKGTIWTYIGVVVGFITTFFVLTRFLSQEEIGLSRVLIDAATLLMSLAQLGTSNSIIRFYSYFRDDNSHDHGFFAWTLIVPFIGFIIFAIIYWAIHVPIQNLFIEKSPLFVDYYYMVLPLTFFMLYQTVFDTNASVLKRIVFPKFVREVLVRILMLATYLLYAFRVISMDGFVIAICSVYAIATLSNTIYLLSLHTISFKIDFQFIDRKLATQYGLYTLFLITSALVSVLAPTLSSFFITAQMGLNYTGIFAIATYIAVLISIPSRSLVAIAQPQLAQHLKDNDNIQMTALLKQVSSNLFLIGIIIFLTIWVNIDLIFHILPNGEQYLSAKEVVFILGLSQLLITSFSISLSALSYSKYYVLTLLFSLILTIGAILFNNILIPQYGMNGAAFANLLSYAIYFAGMLLTCRLALKTNVISIGHVKTFAILLVILLINGLWAIFLSPLSPSIWLDSILRSCLLIGSTCAAAYMWNISPEINALLRSVFIQRH